MTVLQEISISDIAGVQVGNAQDKEAMTGVTVLLFPNGATVGVDISGGGPASRETPLASPLTADNPVHAVVLSGGSAFGLAAGDGVMRWLEERGVGFDTGYARVPLVLQSCLYDLGLGRADVRPDAAMGRAACDDAQKNHPASGIVGAGTGATVGKLHGMQQSMKSGLGIYAAALGDLQIAAVVAVNALGDIYFPETGMKAAGLLDETGQRDADSREELYKLSQTGNLFAGSNTTIGAVVTNGKFSKTEMCKIAAITRCAYARCIRPVATMADGDTVYAASVGNVNADINVAGTLAADVMAQAILQAVLP